MVSETIGRFVTDKSLAEMPDAVRNQAKMAILDWFAALLLAAVEDRRLDRAFTESRQAFRGKAHCFGDRREFKNERCLGGARERLYGSPPRL